MLRSVNRVTVLAAAVGSLVLVPWARANRDAADTTNALDLKPGGGYGYNLTGAGIRIGIFEATDDDGYYLVRTTHEAFRNANGTSRVVTTVSNPAGYSGHATAVAGTIGGNGNRDAKYEGMAPLAQLYAYGTSFTSTMGTATGKSLDLSNHSYSAGYATGWTTLSWNVGGVQKQYDTWFFSTQVASTYGTDRIYRDVYATNPRYGRYNSTSVSVDAVLHDNPKHLAFWSAANSRNPYEDIQGDDKYVAQFSPGFVPVGGTKLNSVNDPTGNYWLVSTANYAAPGASWDTISAYATAKNNVVVGSISDYTADPLPARIVSSSSLTALSSAYGPTDDGRLGVTIVANGVGLASPTSTSDTAYTASISGTSFSSPNAAGTAALLLQHWRNKGVDPMAATQKALLIHTASDMVQFGQVGPDYRTGYGLINGLKAAQFIDSATSGSKLKTDHVMEASISSAQSLAYYFLSSGETVTADGSDLGGIRASLVWTDPEGSANSVSSYNNRAFRALVNDLDVWITDALGNTYYPYTLNPDNPGGVAVRTARNDVDNMEQVFIDAGVLGLGAAFTVHVSVDGVLQGGLPQGYSLLVSGGYLVPEPSCLGLVVLAAAGLGRRRR